METAPNTPTWEQRAALQERPPRSPVLFQSWTDLLFLHWAVAPEKIQATLPPGLWVDCHENVAYLGIVPFYMKRIRPRFLPALPYLSYFLECNVRTYVHDANGVPGVWFYSLDTNRWIAHWIARRFFHLPYFWARMQAKPASGGTDYAVRRRPGAETAACYRYRPTSAAKPAAAESLDYFLLERYLLYAFAARSQQLYRGQVHHRPYEAATVQVDRSSTAPLEWNALPAVTGDPIHACHARRVDVEIFGIETC